MDRYKDVKKDSTYDYKIDGATLMTTKIPDEFFKELQNITVGEDVSKHLIGVIEDQYQINHQECPKFCNFLLTQAYTFLFQRSDALIFQQLIKSFWKNNTGKTIPDPRESFTLEIDHMWLNSMGKGSYTPVHDHAGLFSFVVYLSIPFTREEEHKLNPNIEEHKNLNGCTQFMDDLNLQSIRILVDKNIEGTCLIFPSWVPHVVYPFKSEGRRITVSGNIFISNVDFN